jgi:hypothetical protein
VLPVRERERETNCLTVDLVVCSTVPEDGVYLAGGLVLNVHMQNVTEHALARVQLRLLTHSIDGFTL